ncbi:MAG: FAD-dependent monooxygenase [Saprospiraceae bacterium]|uniref:Kynurenine 3-monooxygenase n=1 Tax=Candidatus Defluviibacterium haderslevense TaxID=2981993 RepID=A0A9D7S9Q0_9BACT|nr:FAD-dependent monooxygenase [Candidatus Defluviibacterium haderslevense]
MKSNQITIAGAGLVGSLLGLRLAQRGYEVHLYESRSDMRKEAISAGRSINLALSDRGITGLTLVGLEEEIMAHAIQMHGRMIHTIQNELLFQPYSERPNECINSISRRTLNVMLMDAFEKINRTKIYFNHKLIHWDHVSGDATFQSEDGHQIIENNTTLLATDGANSEARKRLMQLSTQIRFNYSQTFQNYGYKELTIPPGINGVFQLEKNALHIWPRGHFMMIALPNPDATFTATLFLPYEGPDSLQQLNTKSDIQQYFETHFNDAIPLIPELKTEFFHNPTGHLNSVKCSPWYYEDKLLLVGDAAHAIIPFYGQGMNCGFEDVVVLDQLLDQQLSGEALFSSFTKLRKKSTDAISDLAEDNFVEMRDKVGDPVFQQKRKVEQALEKMFPQYYSKYALVTFRPDVSYYDAMVKGRKQDDLLMKICSERAEISAEQLPDIYKQLNELDSK